MMTTDTLTKTYDIHAGTTLAEFKSIFQGKLITPVEGDYEQARMGWNLSFQQHPAIIVIAQNSEQIVDALRYASAKGMGVSVRSTGHGGILPADNGMLIVTSAMNEVQIDPDGRTARVGAGARWGEVLEAAQTHGLAPLLGSSPTVGVVGYSLGGGLGWLARRYGLAADSVQAIEMVSAHGQTLVASAKENRDLFWAMRGGGGSFGVVTALEVKLVPVRNVFGGNLIYPVELAGEVFKSYRIWTMNLPEEWTTSVRLTNFPPIEVVPEFLRGRSVVMVSGCFCGDVDQGEAYMADWFEWGAHIQNDFRIMPFSEVASISQDPQDPVPGSHSGSWLKELSDEAIDSIIRFGTPQNGPCPLTITEVRHVGGAMARVSNDENAFGQREFPLLMDIVAMIPNPEMHEEVREHIRRFKAALGPQLPKGAYMNFLGGEEARRNSYQAFGEEKYARLAAIKNRYDPKNLFRFGYDISPSGVEGVTS